MNILKFEIKRNAKTTIIWTIAILLIGLLYTAMGPTFTKQSEVLSDFLLSMGEDFISGLGIDVESFFSPIGFFSYIGGFIALAMCIQALLYGLKAYVTEKNQQSVEFLYTKPVSKTKIFTSKLAANVVLLASTQVVVIAGLFVATKVVNDVDYSQKILLLQLLTFVPLQYLFLMLGSSIGVSVSRLKSVVPVALLISFGMFFLNMLSGIIDSDILDNLTFFNYYNLAEIASSGQYDLKYVLLTAVILFVLFVYSLIVINKKDMKVL